MAKWYRLDNFQCPAEGCSSTAKYDWICSYDRTNIYIAQTGYLKCDSTHIGRICECKFDCGNHGTAGFVQVDFERFTFALSQALQLMNKAGSAWVAELITNLGNQFGR